MGENINKVGINPDYEVELNEDELKEEYTKEKRLSNKQKH